MLQLLYFFLFISAYISNYNCKIFVTRDASVPLKSRTFFDQRYYWLASGQRINRANDWLDMIDASDSLGVSSYLFYTNELRAALKNIKSADRIQKELVDQRITHVVLAFLKDLQEGYTYLEYDEVSKNRDSVYRNLLGQCDTMESISKAIVMIDCKDHDYRVLKRYLNDSVKKTDYFKRNLVTMAMNCRRYLYLNRQKEYIVVNIPAAVAEYFRNDSLIVSMRTVIGRKTSKTPAFASYITSIETFPHWNVPRGIAVNEFLPKLKLDPQYLKKNNYKLVANDGRSVDDSIPKWSSYSGNNFPYAIRQSPGYSNALGVIKFNLLNPYSIYLHATNWQGAFRQEYRFLSHGCVRLERPLDLAQELLKGKMNIKDSLLNKKLKPMRIQLQNKIPTFIIYMPVSIEGNEIILLEDVYGRLKQPEGDI